MGALAAVVLAGGVLGAAAVDGPGLDAGGNVRVAGDGPFGAAGEESATTTTPAPPPTSATSSSTAPPASRQTTTSRPTSSVTTRPLTNTTRPQTGTTGTSVPIRSTRASFGPIDPNGVEIAFSPGCTSWTAVSLGVNVTIRVDKATPKVGEPVTFDIGCSALAGLLRPLVRGR